GKFPGHEEMNMPTLTSPKDCHTMQDLRVQIDKLDQ
ncbi:hypothetical protein SAMN05444358_1121, partial [Ruegeria halocynthiae]